MRQLPLVLLCAASTLACGPGFGVGRSTFVGGMEGDEDEDTGEQEEESTDDSASGDGDGDDPAQALLLSDQHGQLGGVAPRRAVDRTQRAAV